MKKKWIVLCHFENQVMVNGHETTLLVTSLEGTFDEEQDAWERLAGMAEEETQPTRRTDMFFEMKEVYSN